MVNAKVRKAGQLVTNQHFLISIFPIDLLCSYCRCLGVSGGGFHNGVMARIDSPLGKALKVESKEKGLVRQPNGSCALVVVRNL